MTEFYHKAIKCPSCGTWWTPDEGRLCTCHQDDCEHNYKIDTDISNWDISDEEFIDIRKECKKCGKAIFERYVFQGVVK